MTIVSKEDRIEMDHIAATVVTYFVKDTGLFSYTEVTIDEKITGDLLSQNFFILYDGECPHELLKKLNKKVQLIKIINGYTQEMEGYSYYGSNPGVSIHEYEDIAEDIMKEFDI